MLQIWVNSMSIFCSLCGKTGFPPDFKCCPYCGHPLTVSQAGLTKEAETLLPHTDNQLKSNTIMSTNVKIVPSRENDLEIVKGTVLWSLNPGEIARRINVDEFEYLSEAKGVYVQDGVVAVLMLDGKIQTKLSSGVYYFDTKPERFGDAVRHIWRFFTGRRQNGSGNTGSTDSGRIGSELQNLGKAKHTEVILVYEAAIPLVFGGGATEDGYVFKPYTIKAGINDIDIALSLQCEISDIIVFSRNYLTKNASYRIVDLQLALHDPIKNTLQEEFAYETADTLILSPELVERVKRAIIKKVGTVMYGITVKQVVDLTMDNADFERFRELERKLSLSKRELEYLIRTNDFKNRLAAEQNNQTIREARSKEELRHALNLLNEDKLLHDDEIDKFCQLLASQKKIREAKTKDDLEAALKEIEKTKLIRDDDFADLKQELLKHDIAREEEIDILQYQSLLRTEKERITVQGALRVLLAKAEKEGEQAEFETANQEQDHIHTIKEKEAGFSIRMTKAGIEVERIKDDYNFEKEGKKQAQAKKKANDDLDLAATAQQIGIAGYKAFSEIERENQAQANQQELALMDKEIELEKARTEVFRGMSSEQIAAIKLDKLDPQAQIALAEAFNSHRELDAAEQKVQIIQEYSEKIASMGKDSSEQMLKVALALIEGQKSQTNNIAATIERVATHRIGEVEKDREEAKEGQRNAEARLDRTQEVSLEHTRGVTEAKVAADAIKGISQSPSMYSLVSLNHQLASIADVIALINAGTITPDFDIIFEGTTYKAMDLKVFESALYEKYHAKCSNPNCGADGYRGMDCPECGKPIK